MDYEKKFILGDLVKGQRTFNGEIIEGKFNGFHLHDKLDPTSVVGVIYVENDRCYDVVAGSIELLESEDEKIREMLIRIYKKADMGGDIFGEGITYKQVVTWLEKQGENNKWKPSKDEMDALYGLAYITNKMDDKKDVAITKLYQDLKREFFNGASYENMFLSSPVDSDINVKKQGEQKPADKVEPKFHEGDWIISDTVNKDYHICKIIGIKDGNYTIESIYGYKGYNQFDEFDNVYRLWTIQDAKDGDVIAENKMGAILMFRGVGNTNWDDVIDYHCYYDCYLKDFIVQEGVEHWGNIENNQLVPATKEQCDTLFAKMKEAGYEWNAEKKELKKIEHKFKVGDWIVKQYLSSPFVIVDIKNDSYILNDIEGNKYEETIDFAHKVFRLWTIQDAKEGDVLAFGDHGKPVVGIVSYVNKTTGKVDVNCLLENNNFKMGNYYNLDTIKPHPATKEQYDALERAMTNAGYRWNKEELKLEKI